MKKLLFILLLASFSCYAQQETLTFTVNVANIGTDTTISLSLSDNAVWSAQVNTVSLTGTLDATFDLLQSNNAVDFNRLAGFSLLTLATATGSQSFESATMSHKRFAFKIIKNN